MDTPRETRCERCGEPWKSGHRCDPDRARAYQAMLVVRPIVEELRRAADRSTEILTEIEHHLRVLVSRPPRL